MDYCAVIIPCYINSSERLNYLKSTFLSVARQNYPTIGLVIDDGSPKSAEIVKLLNEINSDSLRYIKRTRNKNDLSTASNALNYGLNLIMNDSRKVFSEEEKGKITSACYLHSDDMLSIDSIKIRASKLADNAFVYSNTLMIDDDSKPVIIYGCGKKIPSSCRAFSHHSTMWTIDFLKQLKEYIQEHYNQPEIFDSSICAGEDRDVSLASIECLRYHNLKTEYINRALYYYRIQEDSITGLMADEAKKSDQDTINTKHNISHYPGRKIYLKLISDLPWSLLTYMPGNIKGLFRPLKNTIKESINRGFDPREVPLNDPLINIEAVKFKTIKKTDR